MGHRLRGDDSRVFGTRPAVADSIFKQPTLRRPYSLRRGVRRRLTSVRLRPGGLRRDMPPTLERTEGARDAVGSGRTQVYASRRKLKVLRPTGLDASRHRGLSKQFMPQVRQSLGVPRAVFIGLLRAGPGGRPFVRVNLLGRATLHRRGQALLGSGASGWLPAVPAVRAPCMRLSMRARRGLDRRLRGFSAASPAPPPRGFLAFQPASG